MPSVKSQNRTNSTNTDSKRKQEQPRNVKQNTCKTLQLTYDEKQKRRGTSANPKHGKAADEKSNKRNKTNQSKQTVSQIEKAKVSNSKSQLQHEKDSKIRKGKNNHVKLTQKTLLSTQERVNKKLPTNSVNETSDSETTSDAGSSEEGSEVEITKEEERASNQVAAEIQMSEESSDEPEASDTQSEAEQPANKESAEEKTKTAASPVQPVTSPEEDDEEDYEEEVKEDNAEEDKTEEGNRINDADVCEKVSDRTEINELIQKDTKKSNKTGRQCRRSPDLPETGKETKNKMFKNSKAEKKEEKQRAKTEKKKLANEAKQKAKREKKKKKEQKGDNPGPTEEGKVHFLHSNSDLLNGKNQILKKGKHVKERDSPVDSVVNEEKEELKSITTKSITGQSPKSFLKASCRDLKATSEPEEQQGVESVMKGKSQSFLLSKVKMASLEPKGDKTGTKSDELLECGSAERMPSNVMKSLITQRKKVTTLRRVSGWIQRKMPQQFNFRKKLSVLTKAIGVSHWLSSQSIKQKQNTRKTKGNLFKHRMAMRVASTTSLSNMKNKNSYRGKDGSNLQGNTKNRAEKAIQRGDKELEARFAVVLPRMNKMSKAKTAKTPLTAPKSSTPSCPAGGFGASEPKPPNPGAKLVLFVKPDLSLLKTIKKPGKEGFMADVITKSTGSIDASEESSKPDNRTKNLAMENKDESSVLQAARGKLKPSNLSKMPARSIDDGQTRLKGPNTGREDAARTPESSTQHAPDRDTRAAVSAVCSLYEEETDKEVAQLMGEAESCTISQPEVHWTGSPWMSGVPQVCVMSLVLYPWLNKSNLSIL